MTRAVIYCRCSTEEERQVDALKKQVIEAKGCVDENGWTLVDSYVESKSGTTSKGRREYSRLFDDLQTDRFDIIVIKSQDRLMRNTKDWYLFLDRLQTNGKRLYLYIERKFFTTEDSLITGIKAILAEEFSRELSKKIVNAHKNRQKQGTSAVITNNVFGFVKNRDGSIEIDQARKDAVIRMYQYVCEYGCRTTANLLASEGVRSKRGNVLNEASIRRLIRSPLNKGIVIMNKTHFDFETKKTLKNPETEWIYAAGIVPAIVDEELWKRANEAISARACRQKAAGTHPRGRNPGRYMLSGKIICGRCGRPYYRTWRCGCRNKEKVMIEWKCSGYLQSGRQNQNSRSTAWKTKYGAGNGCNQVHLEEERIYQCLEKVNQDLFQTENSERSRIINKTIRLLENALMKDENDLRLERLQSEQDFVRKKKQLLLEKLLDDVISDQDYQIQNRKLEEKLDELEREASGLRQQLNEQTDLTCRLQRIRDNLEQGGFEKAATGQMLNYVHQIVVHEWQLEIQFDPFLMSGITWNVQTLEKIKTEDTKYHSVYVEYPFSPNTEKGRYLDRLTIMKMLKNKPELTAKSIAEELGRSQHMIWNRMEELKKEGYICFEGSGGRGKWKIMKEVPDVRVRF